MEGQRCLITAGVSRILVLVKNGDGSSCAAQPVTLKSITCESACFTGIDACELLVQCLVDKTL